MPAPLLLPVRKKALQSRRRRGRISRYDEDLEHPVRSSLAYGPVTEPTRTDVLSLTPNHSSRSTIAGRLRPGVDTPLPAPGVGKVARPSASFGRARRDPRSAAR